MLVTVDIRENAILKNWNKSEFYYISLQNDQLGDSKNVAQDITSINEYIKEQTRNLDTLAWHLFSPRPKRNGGEKTIYIYFFTDSNVFNTWLCLFETFSLSHNVTRLVCTERMKWLMVPEKKDFNEKGLKTITTLLMAHLLPKGHPATDHSQWLALSLQTQRNNSLHQPILSTAWVTKQSFLLTRLPRNVSWTGPKR